MKLRSVSPYEVELRATNPNTRVVTVVTLTEYAYHAFDAGMQAVQNYIGQHLGCSDRIDITHVGPPLVFILAEQDHVAAAAEAHDVLNRARRRSKAVAEVK